MPERLEVGPEDDGERLDVFLSGHAGSRAAAQRLIDRGLVRVDGETRPKRHALRAGTWVEVADPPAADPADRAAPAPFRVVHEDDHLLVVDKPAGVVVHPGRGNAQGTLVQALEGRVAGGDDPLRPGVVHRLDRETSGLLVLARTEAAHAVLKEAIRTRQVVREYLALVEGRPPARSGTIDAPIGRDRRARTRMSADTDDPREARTHFELEEALDEASLLRVRLETGRTHQIRAHMLAIGHPVVGDPDYGGTTRYGLRRQFLHACRLALTHPVSGHPLELVSPLPGDLQAALNAARRP